MQGAKTSINDTIVALNEVLNLSRLSAENAANSINEAEE
jgi:hypothetical protein